MAVARRRHWQEMETQLYLQVSASASGAVHQSNGDPNFHENACGLLSNAAWRACDSLSWCRTLPCSANSLGYLKNPPALCFLCLGDIPPTRVYVTAPC